MQFLNFTTFLARDILKISMNCVPPTTTDSLTKGILYGLSLLKIWSGTVALETLVPGGSLFLCLYNRCQWQQQQQFNITTKY